MNHLTQTQVINGITITREITIIYEQIEDTMNAREPRLYTFRLAELMDLYPPIARVNTDDHKQYIVDIKKSLLSHDCKYGSRDMPKHATVYRVALHPDRDDIEVVSIGMERGDTTPDTVYSHFSHLPKWMQDRLHVMNLLDDTAPTEHIEGIGRRISKYVFWMEIPKENGNG